jgi:uracil-DNA glycosylase family 4
MTESLEALRGYVHFLHEREGVRQIRLTRTAQAGLARLVAKVKAMPSSSGGPDNSLSVLPRTSEATGGRRELPRQSPMPSQPPPSVRRLPTETVPRCATATLPNEAPLEISGSTKVEQLRHLAERASVCVKCPHLVARRHTVVFGVGNPDAKLMFVGEAPGEEEDLQGEPFVGRAGQLLTKMILAMGLTREQIYIANIVKCRPDMPPGASGNRKPTKQEMDTCVPYLRAQIDVIKPSAMVALGATAVEGLLGPLGTIGSLRGKFLEYRGTPLMPTYHPSYLLRNQSNTEKRKVWEDLLKVMERVEFPISDKQRGFFLAK